MISCHSAGGRLGACGTTTCISTSGRLGQLTLTAPDGVGTVRVSPRHAVRSSLISVIGQVIIAPGHTYSTTPGIEPTRVDLKNGVKYD